MTVSALRARLTGLLARTALLVSALTLLARLVGFGRWLVFSPTVGAGAVGTAYQSANMVPNILFEVVAGGALAGAVVPLLAVPLARRAAADARESAAGTADANRIVSALLTWALAATVPLALALALLSGPISGLLVDPGPARTYAAGFLLVFAVQLPFYAVSAVLTGVLQAHRRFLWPAFVPLLSSLVVIGTYGVYGALATDPDVAAPSALALLAWGTTAGVFALSLPLALPTARTGIRVRPTFRFPPGVARRAVRLATAGIVALAAQQAAVLVTMLVSNRVGGDGVFVVFSYVQAIYLLPYAVLAVPVATIAFQNLSALLAEGADAGEHVRRTTTRVLWLGVLGGTVLVAASEPLQTFFGLLDAAGPERFTGMAAAVVLMALAVPGWCLVAWLQRVLYAHERGRYVARGTALGWAGVALTVLIGAAVLLGGTGSPGEVAAGATVSTALAARTLGLVGLAHAVGMTLAAVLLFAAVRRVLGLVSWRRMLRDVFLAGSTAVVAAGAGVLVARGLAVWPLLDAGTVLEAGGIPAALGVAVLRGVCAGLVAAGLVALPLRLLVYRR
ncbi:murein biosynthesis integral membrane protein MurJ [Brevibacterium litoralis]|uniref:murein biosynthesis integral membrane protein MurJ n=1 Tax=Brevibacterium litoralis TaxID=3138935 RepID=UPI0032EE1BFA